MNNPILLVDTWESGGAIDEALLFAKGVSGMLVRLNDTDGGHHMDTGFAAQWQQAGQLPIRIPYFVYNPWVSGEANFNYLASIMPAGAISVCLDIEVSKPGYSPVEYSTQVAIFHNLVKSRWNCMIYTGEWFMNRLSSWPTDALYWWAQYPNSLYPQSSMRLSWESLRAKLQPLEMPFNADEVPGRLSMWQCSGDRLIMDGCEKPMDINTWMGSMQELVLFAGLNDTTPIPEPNTDKVYHTHKGVTVHMIERFGSRCVVHVVDPKVARVYVSPGGFRTPGGAITRYGAQIAVNGGGWPNVTTPGFRANEIWCSDGALIQAKAKDDRPYINVDVNGKPSISENSRLIDGLRNAWGFDRILGKDGQFNTRISDRTTKDARTGSGITADGKLIILSAEGNDRFQHGLSFPEMWEVLKEFGAIIAGNNDGGSSSAVINTWLSPESLISPSDGQQAPVINQVMIFADPTNSPPPTEEPPMTDFIFLKVDVQQKERENPSMFEPDSRVGQIVGTVIKTAVKVPNGTLAQQLTKDTDSRSDALFVKTASGWWQPAFYQGKWFMSKTTDPTEPQEPPVPFPGTVQDLSMSLPGITFGKVILNGEEWIRKI